MSRRRSGGRSSRRPGTECFLAAPGSSHEPVARPPSKVSNGEDRDLLGLDHVPDCEGKPGQKEPPDSCDLIDARPEGPCHRAFGDRIERVAHLIDEVGSEARELKFLPVACRVEVGRGSRVEADLHALPAMPALCEARLDRFPVLGGDRA